MTTHDLPPTAGYLRLAHVAIRDRLGLLTRPVEEEVAEEEAIARGPRGAGGAGPARRGRRRARDVEALHRFIAQTPSRMLGVAVTDLGR